MEKINITSIEPKFGKPNTAGVCTPFWAIQLADGRKATLWDENMAKTAMAHPLGTEFTAEMKTNPAGYINIRALNIDTSVAPTEKPVDMIPTKEQINEAMSRVQPADIGKTLIKQPTRENSIVAQCILKGAVELSKQNQMAATGNNEQLGEFLCMAVTELHGAYKVALDLLE